MKVLVQFKGNWAGEMDIYGFTVLSPEGWNEYKSDLLSLDQVVEWNIGSHTTMAFANGESVIKSLKLQTIADEDAEVIKRLFGGHQFGKVPIYVADSYV